jgi:hypothetical protein
MKHWVVVLLLVVAVRPVLAGDDAPMYTCKPRTGRFKPILAQPEIDLDALILWVEGISCKNVIVGAGVDVSTKLRIHAENPITAKQALKLFRDAVDAAGFVAQDKGDNLVIKLGPGSPKLCAGETDGPPPDPLEAFLETEIKKIDATHVQLSTYVGSAIVANQLGVINGARIVRAISDGKPVGYKLYSIRPTSFYGRLGLANGDVVLTINGLPLASLEQTLDAYNKLHDATEFQLGIERNHKPMTLTITVK